MMGADFDLRVTGRCPGRALYVGRNGEAYIARRYAIYRSDDWGASWKLDCFVPASAWKAAAMHIRLGARLLRYYIAALEVLADGSRIVIARDGIYRAGPDEARMSRVFRITRGSRPLHLAVDGARVLFGEYGGNLEPYEVFIYVSEDAGKTFHVGFRFPRGDVRHIHSVAVDPYQECYWVLAGDYGRQPGIACLSRDLRSLQWINRANQRVRAVGALVEPDCLLYGTDSDVERNYLVRLDKRSGVAEDLCEVDGTSLYASRFGPLRVVATCTEPNPTATGEECSLYASLNGVNWERFFVHKKDAHHSILFQFGMLVLPYGYGTQARGMFSGQAVAGADDRVSFFELADQGPSAPCATGCNTQAKDPS
jgi:hypothetical protein